MNRHLARLGVKMPWDYVVALAQSQHGQEHRFQRVDRSAPAHGQLARQDCRAAEGGFEYGDKRYKIVDLPGTYSLLASSADERSPATSSFGQPDVTAITVDATRLERNSTHPASAGDHRQGGRGAQDGRGAASPAGRTSGVWRDLGVPVAS